MTDLPPTRIIGVLLCLLLFTAAWVHGSYHGARSASNNTPYTQQLPGTVTQYPHNMPEGSAESYAGSTQPGQSPWYQLFSFPSFSPGQTMGRTAGQDSSLTSRSTEVLSSRWSQAEAERAALRTTISELQSALHDAQVQSDKDKLELELYRRIANKITPVQSVTIDAVTLSNYPEPSLNMTLVQWRGRDRISGKLVAALGYESADSASTGRVMGRASGDGYESLTSLSPIEYQFRFFQHLSIPIPNPEQEPDFLELRLEPDRRGAEDIVQRRPWSDLSKIVD